jgi:hypothetical protein
LATSLQQHTLAAFGARDGKVRANKAPRSSSGASWVRTVLSGAFMLLMLAAAHLSMVVVNALEARIDKPQPSAGQSARMFLDVPLAEELQLARKKNKNPEQQLVLDKAIDDLRAGRTVVLNTLPVTPSLVRAAIVFTLLGFALTWLTVRLKSDATQSILGIFAGNLIWTGGVEYGLTIAARALGVAKTVGVQDGQLFAMYGEYVLLKYTWGAFALIMAYLFFVESSRCPAFLIFREKLPVMRGATATGKIDNYGPRSAFQYATTVWGFYLLLLWAYDEQLFGVHGIFTNGLLFVTLAGSFYCVWRLHQHRGWGPAVRYAVGAIIVVWTPIEILGKWGVFAAPWVLLRSSSVLIFFGGLALGTWLLWRSSRRKTVVTP